ncbi:vWA domain-containing protein [Candidatus Soleaferrea massiliensis]|uniref:vWA domain-containing protein n=1 Tax=Candidatus Soleaferrea massiliensis TaxID=1470354 RepID=UPI00058BA4FB|nr:vWA domain-containing protein [Candidatus Soleaferrea massiliensis]
MKKLIKRRFKAVVSFMMACTVLCSAATEVLGVQAQLPAPVPAASADIWKPDDIVYPEGITLHKEVTGSTGSRKEGNLAFDLKLGMKAEQNPIVAPSDIVLVLDRSGSMDTDLKTDLTADETPDTSKTYYVTNRSGTSYEVTYSGGYWQYRVNRTTYYVAHETDPLKINTGSGTQSYPYRYQFYTKESRMDALKTAAKDFIDRVANEAERYGVNHRIDLISYSSDMVDNYNRVQSSVLKKHTNSLFESAAQKKQVLKNEIDSLKASGGTYTNAGLAQAIDDFNNSANQTNEENRKRVVVLFTDGAPTGNNSGTSDGSDWNTNVASSATDASKVLKAEKGSDQTYQKQTQFKVFNGTPNSDAFNNNVSAKGCGASIYVVGVLDDELIKTYTDKNGVDRVNNFMEGIASSPYENFYENCQNVEQLNNMFHGIIASSVTINLNNSTVREYIDPKFELTAASMEALKKQGAVVSQDKKGQYVEWTLKIVEPGKQYWFEGVQIKPKDETSGNYLPTNIDGDTSFQTQDKRNQWPFPLPHVNVPADPASNPLKTDKISVVHGDDPQNPDRMYDVIMKAWGDKPLAKDFDFTLVLDKSGSMGRNRARVEVATSRDELQYLNKAANNYDICQYAWKDGSRYYPVRYNNGQWQYAQYNSFTNATGAVSVSASRWYSFDVSKITKSKPLYGYKWALLQKSIGMFLDQLADQVALSQNGNVSTHAMLSAQVNIMDFAGDNAGSVNYVTNGYENVNTSTLDSIKNKLFSERTNNGNTPTDEGMKAAYNALRQGNVAGNGHQKVVILFTDGVPGPNATSYSQVTARNALNYAEQIRAIPDTSMYAVGLFGDLQDDAKVTANVLNETKPNGWQGEWLTSRDTVDLEEDFLIPMVGGEQNKDQYLRVTSSHTMESILIDLAHKFSQYTLRDYIDPRFYPVDRNGNRLAVGAVIETGVVAKGSTLPAGTKVIATLKLDSNGYYFEWTGQELPSPTSNPNDFWTQTITLKAKETFIGGNDIPTNIGGISGVYTDPKNPMADVPFPEPTVNVPVRFEVGRTETTIFLGESVPANLPKQFMFDSSKVSFQGDVFINPTDTGEFRYEWIRGADTNIGSAEQFPDGEQPQSDIIYTLAVTFVPKHDDSITSAGLEVEDVRQVGLYTVHVVSGSVKINKQINLNDVNLSNGDPIFVFCLQKLNENGDVVETKYDYVRFDDEAVNQRRTDTLSVEWRNLSKGTYRVVEQKALRYDFDRFGPVTSNGTADATRESVTFQIGLSNSERTVLPNGEGTFINKKTLDDYFTDTDIVNNQFEIVTLS